jgi:uncharacterized protein YtpQ (UPF0354 family)
MENPPTKDEFAQLLTDRIHQAGEKGGIVYEAEEFRLRGEGERAPILFLTNAYKEFCSADEGLRKRVVKHWVRNWFNLSKDMPEDFEDAKSDLLPIVRSRAHFDINSLREEVENGKPLALPYQVLGEHFGVGLVYDLPELMQSIQQAQLDAWGITFYEAMEVARENLSALPAKFIGPQSGEGAYLSATGDSYDGSRLLLTDIIRRFQVKGDPVALIPNRENLVIVGSEDDEGLSGMLKMTTEALKQPRPISGIALRLHGDEWVPWLPAVSHPPYKDFRQLQLQTLGQNYAEQKDLLDKLHVRNGEDVFVASFSALPAPDGRVLSYATWTDTTNSLLPKTDVLVLGRLGGEPRVVEWQRVMDVAGDLVEPLDIYPPRYRVREFPSEEQLAAMGNMLADLRKDRQ